MALSPHAKDPNREDQLQKLRATLDRQTKGERSDQDYRHGPSVSSLEKLEKKSEELQKKNKK